jgi:hypothetical protein
MKLSVRGASAEGEGSFYRAAIAVMVIPESSTGTAPGPGMKQLSFPRNRNMDDPIQATLVNLVSLFRLAILRSRSSTLHLATLQEFPRGACGDASLLLAKYLEVNNCGHSFYVLGERHGQQHAWLQLEEFIIDITADQFDDQDAGVIVTTESAWHASFNGKIHNVADFCLYDRTSVFLLTRAYQAITSCLKTLS